MAFTNDLTSLLSGSTGGVGCFTGLTTPLTFADLFDGLPQFYAGSTIQVQEIFKLSLSIDNILLLDIDKQWFPEKVYAGTWTLNTTILGQFLNSEDRGFIENYETQIVRYSTYTIVGNPDVPVGLHEQAKIDNCNFSLLDVTVALPGFEFGNLYPNVNEAVFASAHSLRRVSLIDTTFFQKISSVGLFISPGLSILGASYEARIINQISADLEAFPVSLCDLYPQQTCSSLYQQFITSQNIYLPVSGLFATEADAIAYSNANNQGTQLSITPATFTCPISPNTQYAYWVMQWYNAN